MDSGSEVNNMTPAYASKLSLVLRTTNIIAWKIHGLTLETYRIATVGFSLKDILKMIWFVEQSLLLADTSMKMILGMLFLCFSNTDFYFGTWELTWKSYTATEALLTTRRMELIDKKEFAKAALNKNLKIFVI